MTYQVDLFGDGDRIGDSVRMDARHPVDAVLWELVKLSARYDLVKDLPMKGLTIYVQPLVVVDGAAKADVFKPEEQSQMEEAA